MAMTAAQQKKYLSDALNRMGVRPVMDPSQFKQDVHDPKYRGVLPLDAPIAKALAPKAPAAAATPAPTPRASEQVATGPQPLMEDITSNLLPGRSGRMARRMLF